MTEILERRWKCDWCGNVSPVLHSVPSDWIWKVVVADTPIGWTKYCDWTFCCAYHEILWKNKRAVSAETPEEAKV